MVTRTAPIDTTVVRCDAPDCVTCAWETGDHHPVCGGDCLTPGVYNDRPFACWPGDVEVDACPTLGR